MCHATLALPWLPHSGAGAPRAPCYLPLRPFAQPSPCSPLPLCPPPPCPSLSHQYWRNVLNYKLLLDTQGNTVNQVEFKFLRVILLCLVVKTIEKGNREETERHLHDYNGECSAGCQWVQGQGAVGGASRARARGWPHAFPLISAALQLCPVLLPLAHHPLTLSPLTPPPLQCARAT